MKYLLLFSFFLLLIQFSKSKETSISLHYFGDTTFINLPPPSRRTSFRYEFESYQPKVGMYELEEISKILEPKTVEVFESIGFKLHGTKLGDVIIHPNFVQTSFFKSPNGEKERQGWILTKDQYPTEDYLLGDIHVVKLLSKTFDILGFRQNSIRVNIEVPLNSTLITEMMINYYRPENREEMLNENNFKLEKEFSTGFKNLLFKKDEKGNFMYKPTMEELFNDFIIRQGAEFLFPCLNESNIWEEPIESLKKKIIDARIDEYVPYGLDISPILLHFKPKDEVAIKLSKFIQPNQSIQFREYKGKLQTSIRRTAGMMKATEFLGIFIADSAISQISFIELDVIQNIRNYLKLKKNIYFKYIVWNSETCPNVHKKDHQNTIKWYTKKEKFILGHIETGIFGYCPFIIPGDSVVWHQRQEHRFNILGKYNPALINTNIAHFLENKWLEYKYFETYCKNFLPKSKLVYDLLPNGVSRFNVAPEIVFSLANEHFPNGWILKGVWDYNGIEHVITHKSNIIAKFNDYRLSNFDDIYEIKKQNLVGCEPIEDLNDELKNHTHFIGFKVGTLLKDSAHTFIQEYKEIEREYRIECIGGICPFDAMNGDDDKGEHDSKATEELYQKQVHAYFMKCVNSLPEILKGIPLTADPAILKNGEFTTFETNPGGNGWLIHNMEDIAGAHNRVLRRYIKMYKEDSHESPLHRGMKLEEEMKFFQNLMNIWNISLPIHAKRFENLLPDRIIDSEHFLTTIKKEMLNYSGPKILAPKFVSKQVRELSMKKAFDYVLNHMEELIKPEPLDFVHAIENFAFMKRSMPESTYSIIQQIIKKLQSEFGSKIVEKHLNKLKQFELKLPLNYKLNQTMTKRLARITIATIEEIGDLQVLDIEHQELRITLQRFFDILLNQNLKEWNTILFKDFDILGVARFKMYIEMIKNEKTRKEGLKKISPILSKLTDILGVLTSIDRTGFKFPGFSTQSFLKIWTPELRRLYDLFLFSDQLIKNNELYQDSFLELTYAVTHIIYTSCDYSLFKLPKENFKEEYKFLQEAARISSLIGENDINGEIIDCLMLLGGESDEKIKKIIQENQFFLVLKQSKRGYWKLDKKVNIHAIHTAITGLIDHDYAIEGPKEFGEIVPYDYFKKRLNEDGLMLKNYDFHSNKQKHPNYDQVKSMVQRTFRLYSLERFYQFDD